MTPAEIKAAGAQFLETVMNQGNVAALDQFLAPTFVDHSPWTGAAPTAEGMKESISRFRAALPTGQTSPRSPAITELALPPPKVPSTGTTAGTATDTDVAVDL